MLHLKISIERVCLKQQYTIVLKMLDRVMRTTFMKIESRSSTMENITETCCRIRDKGLWRANTGCLENR